MKTEVIRHESDRYNYDIKYFRKTDSESFRAVRLTKLLLMFSL